MSHISKTSSYTKDRLCASRVCIVPARDYAAEFADLRAGQLARNVLRGGTTVLGVEAVSCSCSQRPRAICVCLRIFWDPPCQPWPIVRAGESLQECSPAEELPLAAQDLPLEPLSLALPPVWFTAPALHTTLGCVCLDLLALAKGILVNRVSWMKGLQLSFHCNVEILSLQSLGYKNSS